MTAHDVLLLMTNLSQVNDAEQVKRLFVEAISDAMAPVKLRWVSESPATPEAAVIPLQTLKDSFGAIVLDTGTLPAQADLELLQTACHLLSVVLENLTQQERLRSHRDLLWELAADPIFVADPVSGCILDANRAAEELIGRLVNELRGLPIETLHPPEEAERYRKLFEEHVVADSGTIHECEVVRHDGSRISVEINARLATIADRQVLIGVFRDVSERNKAKRELENAFNLSADLICMCTTEGDLLKISPSCERILGYKQKELLEMGWAKLVHPDDVERTNKEVEKQLRGRSVAKFTNRYRHKDGSYRTLEWQATAAKDGIVWASARDITEHKRLEEQLRQSEKMQAIGQLAGGVAHDFNNQLTGIMGYADILVSKLEDKQLKSEAQAIVRAAKRSADLTQQLLAFARKGKNLSIPVNLHKVIAETVTLLEHSIDKRITIQEILKASSCMATGDPTQLQNVFLNIALNARDAMPEGGKLIFETSVVTLDEEYCTKHPYDIIPGRYVQVCVTDSGMGMDEETQKHMFEPFFTTKQGKGGGAGMGLAAVYGTIKNHQGAVNVYSEVGHGTTFKVYLPLAKSAAEEAKDSDRAASIKGTAHILFVDDEEIVRDITALALRQLGYKVAICKDGAEAVEYYRKAWKHVDLVIVDMIMPGMGGKDTFIAMREINPEIKALLVSGYAINGEAQSILSEGVLGFLQKPFQIAELSEKVAEALGMSPKDQIF